MISRLDYLLTLLDKRVSALEAQVFPNAAPAEVPTEPEQVDADQQSND